MKKEGLEDFNSIKMNFYQEDMEESKDITSIEDFQLFMFSSSSQLPSNSYAAQMYKLDTEDFYGI